MTVDEVFQAIGDARRNGFIFLGGDLAFAASLFYSPSHAAKDLVANHSDDEIAGMPLLLAED